MSAYLMHLVSLDSTRRLRQRNSASSPAVESSPALDSRVRLPRVSYSYVIRITVLSYLSFCPVR